MGAPDYEYHGLMVATWDLFRGDTSNWEDRAFFLELIRRTGQPVLDVGCGTGRLLLDYLAQGIDIDGIDNSPDMLGLLQKKAQALNLQPRVYQQEMQALDLPTSLWVNPGPLQLLPAAFRTSPRPPGDIPLLRPPEARRRAGHAVPGHVAAGRPLGTKRVEVDR